MTRGALHNGAHPGLHLKPLDAAMCQRRIAPAAAKIDEFERNTQNTNKTQLLASNYGCTDKKVL
jgi:hypothetical protein